MGAEANSQPPIESSPIFPVEGFPITFRILTVREGFHEQTGRKSFAYIPPGQYAQLDLGEWNVSEELPDYIMGNVYLSISRQLDANRVYFSDDDDNPWVTMTDMRTVTPFSPNPLGGFLYLRIAPPTVLDIEKLAPTGDPTAWGFPDRPFTGSLR